MTGNQKRPCLPEAADAEPVVSGLELAAARVPVLGVLPRQALANQRWLLRSRDQPPPIPAHLAPGAGLVLVEGAPHRGVVVGVAGGGLACGAGLQLLDAGELLRPAVGQPQLRQVVHQPSVQVCHAPG